MSMNEVVAKRIESFLEKREWTQVQLAKKMNISKQVMNNIIKGNKNITIAEVNKIAQILDVDIDALTKPFDKEEKPEPIIAFLGEVSSEAAKEGLKNAKQIMDRIVFHQKINDSYQNMLK